MDHSFQVIFWRYQMEILLAVIIALIGITIIAIDIISRAIDVQVTIVHTRLEIKVSNLITKVEQTKMYHILSWLNLVNAEEGN